MPTTNFTRSQFAPYLYGDWRLDLSGYYRGTIKPGFAFEFTGTDCVLATTNASSTMAPFSFSVDGGAIQNPTQVSGNITIASALTEGRHQVFGYYSGTNCNGGKTALMGTSCTLNVTGAAPAIGPITAGGTLAGGGTPVAGNYGGAKSAWPLSADFTTYGYVVCPSSLSPGGGSPYANTMPYWAGSGCPTDNTPVISTSFFGPSANYPGTSAGNSPVTIAFRATTDRIGFTGLVGLTVWARVFVDGAFAWRGQLAPDDSKSASPVLWCNATFDNTKPHNFRVVLTGAPTQVILGSPSSTFASTPPPRRKIMAAIGDSRTACVNCTDYNGDYSLSWAFTVGEILGYDTILHAVSGAYLSQFFTAGTYPIGGTSQSVSTGSYDVAGLAHTVGVPGSLFDLIVIDLGTNTADWSATWGSSNAHYADAASAFVKLLYGSYLSSGGQICYVLPDSSGGALRKIPPADNSMDIAGAWRTAMQRLSSSSGTALNQHPAFLFLDDAFIRQSDSVSVTNAPTLTYVAGKGALSNGTYQVYAKAIIPDTSDTPGYADTLASPVATITLSDGTSTQAIQVTATGLPANAVAVRIYFATNGTALSSTKQYGLSTYPISGGQATATLTTTSFSTPGNSAQNLPQGRAYQTCLGSGGHQASGEMYAQGVRVATMLAPFVNGD